MSGDRPFSWGTFDAAFADELGGFLRGRRVLEVFAGNGLLASMLAKRGVEIVATTRFSCHDGHEMGMYHPVEELDARAAIAEYGDRAEVLLMAWPPATEAAAHAAAQWGGDRDIVFVGETAVDGLPYGGCPGCASDAFFEFVEETGAFRSYAGRNGMDRATVRRTDPVKARLALEGAVSRPGRS